MDGAIHRAAGPQVSAVLEKPPLHFAMCIPQGFATLGQVFASSRASALLLVYA